ncbi:hypothetical protein FCV25MIE_09141 [Fagus crenata]
MGPNQTFSLLSSFPFNYGYEMGPVDGDITTKLMPRFANRCGGPGYGEVCSLWFGAWQGLVAWLLWDLKVMTTNWRGLVVIELRKRLA